jgi:hypothetical protein
VPYLVGTEKRKENPAVAGEEGKRAPPQPQTAAAVAVADELKIS